MKIKRRDEIPADLLPAWERRAPGRYVYELDALSAVVGDTLRIDDRALQAGRLEVTFDWPLDGNAVPLAAIFPDSFPRLRPIVNLRCDPADYPQRHCSPLDGNLCLLGRDTAQWPENWTLADLLSNQLKHALEGTGQQDPQGEPAEYWWNLIGLKNSYCLIDSSWTLDGATSGQLKLNYTFDSGGNDPFAIRAIATELKDAHGKSVQTWTSKVPQTIVSPNTLLGPWIYRDQVLLPNGTQRGVDEILSWFPNRPRPTALSGSFSGRVMAVLHRSELGPDQTGLGWIFLIEFGHRKAFQPPKPGKAGRHTSLSFIPSLRAGTTDIGARVPATSVLQNKKIVVVGAGAIGAPLALDLARNGCSDLPLLDNDTVEPGNSIRWPLGVTSWAKQKTSALADFIRREYPWCDASAHVHRVGTFSNGAGDEAIFSELLRDADLVVDATATYGVATTLSDFCRERNLPLISFYASPPVTGGTVALFSPKSGCPTCLEFAHEAGQIPRPPGFDSTAGLQQPAGCAEMTFTGASYNLKELSLQAMRVVVNVLSAPYEGSIVYTLALPGDAKPPQWTLHLLEKMDDCSCRTR